MSTILLHEYLIIYSRFNGDGVSIWTMDYLSRELLSTHKYCFRGWWGKWNLFIFWCSSSVYPFPWRECLHYPINVSTRHCHLHTQSWYIVIDNLIRRATITADKGPSPVWLEKPRQLLFLWMWFMFKLLLWLWSFMLWNYCSAWKVLTTRNLIHMWQHWLQNWETLSQLGQIPKPKRYQFNRWCKEHLPEIA